VTELLTEERLRLYPRALLGALCVALLLAVAQAGSGDPAARLGGDYPAFHAAGELVWQGRGAELYDAAVQEAAQQPYMPDGGWLPFPYPPPLAVAHALLAPLPYGLAFAVHTLVLLGALAGAAAALRPVLGLRWPREALVVALLCFPPMFRALLGGQGTPLIALLVAGSVRALHDERPVVAGVVAGLLLYKPQLGLPLVGLVALHSRGRSVPGSLGVAVGMVGLSYLVAGPDWFGEWVALLAWFQPGAQQLEVASSVSLLAFAESLFGLGHPLAYGVGGVATLGVIGLLSWAWWRRLPWGPLLGITAVALPLIPPHGLFYDAGLAGLGLWVLGGGGLWLFAAGVVGLGAPWLGVQPLAPLLVGFAVWQAVRSGSGCRGQRLARRAR
jgi:hypothetical protein